MSVKIPGPPELLPGRPDAIIDLQTDEGVALAGGQWRYGDTRVRETGFVSAGPDLGPSGPANRTYEVVPRAHAADFDDSAWTVLNPADTQRRLSTGRVCFNWYRITVTIPERVGDLDPADCTVVFETVIDDYAEIWVNGELPRALGEAGGPVVAGFNALNRVVLTRHARPGQQFTLAVFGINGPISAAPANYIWMRTATLDFYSPSRACAGEQVPVEIVPGVAGLGALRRIAPPDARLERVAGGFEFTEGPVWTRDGALLFSSPNTNTIYRWAPAGAVTVFRPKSGYTGTDIGRYAQPGSNGLTFDPEGRLTICQHWPYLADADLQVQRAFEIEEYTDPHHQATVPHTPVVAPGLMVDKVYVGYWFWGRPSPFQLWEDLQDLLRRGKDDFDPTTEQARASWMAAHVTQLTPG